MSLEARTWAIVGVVIAPIIIFAVLALAKETGRSTAAPPAEVVAAAEVTTAKPRYFEAEISHMEAACDAVRQAQPPPADRPTPAQRKALANCQSADLYHGIDGHRDLRKARHCALIEWEGSVEDYPEDRAGPTGAGVLAMIYANGEGVAPDYAFATRMACTAGYSTMDIVAAVGLVEARQADPKAKVDICDAAGSGWLGGQCAYQKEHRRDLERDRRLRALQKGWPEGRKRGWATVVATRTALEEARTDNEIDTSGTLRLAFIVAEEARIRNFDEALLKDLVAGGLKDGAARARKADRAMNVTYRKVMAQPVDDLTWPLPEEIRSTQRAWLRHRDSWRRFADAHWPGSGDGVVARLTADRQIILRCHLPDPPESLHCEHLM